MTIQDKLCTSFGIQLNQAAGIIALLDDGATIPFIARYRKEVTGNLDDQVLRQFADQLSDLRALEERRADIVRLLGEQGVTDPELLAQVAQADSLTRLEDLYRPCRPKRRTRASIARSLGLSDLAARILEQQTALPALREQAAARGAAEPALGTTEAALAGALDILAEQIADDAAIRAALRAAFWRDGLLISKARRQEDSVYRQYYAFSEPVRHAAGHRILAIDRGEREGCLSVSVEIPAEMAQEILASRILRARSACPELIFDALSDAWKRLLAPSLANEIRSELTRQAQEKAIEVFAANLRNLLMTPPIAGRTVLGLDPGYRNGCKLAVVDPTGRLLTTGVIYPAPPQNRLAEAAQTIKKLIAQWGVNLIVIGNGTASRETEQFVRRQIEEDHLSVPCLVVSEAGASVYSASPLGAAEFPDLDVSVRSAVSIARRVQDPLAELVKIEPQAIGVGQYQHDLNQKRLTQALGGVVEACVSEVGVNLNTASAALLSHVAGISPALARAIVDWRESHGAFTSRQQLLSVPRLGPRTFEQAAGFLRIPGAAEPLDNTSVHPESYGKVHALAGLLKMPISPELAARAREMDLSGLSAQLDMGLYTLTDILDALARPGRDPREDLPHPLLDQEIREIRDLRPGMVVRGVVRNVAAFGAFVDLGLHQDGLIHISELSDHFVRDPATVIQAGQAVTVRILSVDLERGRIALSRKGLA
jgi:uncharacterized protein